jgi:transcriptional regulator GlxA family with amidase domain
MLTDILVFHGVDELDAFGPLEVLRNAAAAGADFQTRLVSLDGSADITGNHGLRFGVDAVLGSGGHRDLLIVPGGGWAKRSAQGAWAEAQRGAIPRAIANEYRAGTMLASVCTGAMLVAAAGLLKGRRAITHHRAIEDLRQAGAEIVDARIVDDGDIVTAGGVTSGIDLALYLVERFAGSKIAQQVATGLEYERRGPVHVSAGTAQHIPGRAAR